MASPRRTLSVSSSSAWDDGDDSDHHANVNDNTNDDDSDNDDDDSSTDGTRRRRPSAADRLANLSDMSGLNSIRSFARSYQRAVGFLEALPNSPPFVLIPDQQHYSASSSSSLPTLEPMLYPRRGRAGSTSSPGLHSRPRLSLLRQHQHQHHPDAVVQNDNESDASTGPDPTASSRHRNTSRSPETYTLCNAMESKIRLDLESALSSSSHSEQQSRFAVPPQLATPPLVGSFASFRSYGTIQPNAVSRSRPQPRLEPAAFGDENHNHEREPVLVREIEQDGKVLLRVEGQSTWAQTVFNSINALVGVGILSLPLALQLSGWVFGLIMLSLCAAVTAHTSTLIAKCMTLDPGLITFSDLAYISFGRRARLVTAVIFTAELIGANVALIVLFADSLALLFPSLFSLNLWKVICSVVLVPLNFIPLRLLSFTSIVGIMSTFMVVTIVFVDGIIKTEAPGSLSSPAVTYLFPRNWASLPLAYGLFLSPFSSHSILPNIYRDMRHPTKFADAVKVTFTFTYIVDLAMAIVGILMFGDGVRDEITSNIIQSTGYPKALTYATCALVAVISLTKVPLNTRPLINSAELLFGIYHAPDAEDEPAPARIKRAAAKFLIRVLVVVVLFAISILFPAFDSILSLMGSLFCGSISVVLPISFYFKLFGSHISSTERILLCIIIVVFGALSIVGTAFTILPKHMLGLED